jgi:parvulin-like peptidyl-prolyl isomerase
MEHYKKEVAKDRDLKKINKAMDLLEEGNDFEEVTKEYSKGETAEEGGDLGWLKKEHLVPEVAEKAFEMKEGEYSDIIQSSLGNHIIYLEDTRGEGEEKEVKIKQIFTREGDFLGWFEDIKKEMDVKVFLNEYEWDKEKGELIFKDSNIEKKEEKIRMRSTGDPSVN